ncbi:hypothetical protein [Terrabacter sp. Root181]|uniref:hypothetical protein n=1 Tax=Terrabacter sp. Root181 TaxID=1736484 RepID=UPI0006F7A127|nr:hypothetical protein [Terrabacter sp. Root181]KRB46063.1 hypothetical protein ASD90_10015 [Terrabacter sp. Root181]
MRILDLTDLTGRPVSDFGSEGFSVAGLARGSDTHVVVLALEHGGIIGRHPAVGRQLLLLVAGDALVSGDDGVLVELAVGHAAVWDPGESHETRSATGMTALVVEGDVTLA